MKITLPDTYIFKYTIIFPAISAALYTITLFYSAGWLSFISLTPLLYSMMQSRTYRNSLEIGTVYGLVLSITLLYWIPGTVDRFLGGMMPIALLFFLAGMIIFAIFFSVIAAGVRFIHLLKRLPIWFKTLGIASCWALTEYLLSSLLTGAPWFQAFVYKSVLDTPFLFQIASIGGGPMVSFFLVAVNTSIVYSLMAKQAKRSMTKVLLQPVLYILLLLITNFLLKYQFDRQENSGKKVSFSIINENTPADLKWNKENGNQLAQNLFSLHSKAAALNPNYILWSESAIPWTFRTDDPFVQEIRKTPIPQLLGINSYFNNTKVYNSVYYIDSNEKFQRYDKNFLLTFAEEPLSLFNIPLSGNSGYYVEPGNTSNVFTTEYAKIGVIICNESFVDQAAYSLVRNGAEVLALISNDGWIHHSAYLTEQHWKSAKIRSVENRRPIVVNCNLGYSGAIDAGGNELYRWKSPIPVIKKIYVEPQNQYSFYSKYPLFFIYIYISITLSCILYHITKPTRSP